MPFSLRLTVFACVLSLSLACSNQADTPTGTSTPSGTPTAAPTPTSTPPPTSTRKGVSDGADVIINTVVAHDAISLEKLTKLATVERVDEIASLLPVDEDLKRPIIERIRGRLATLPERPPEIPIDRRDGLGGFRRGL